MNASIALLAAGTGYLIGSISFARVLGRWLAPGESFRTTTLAWGEDRRFEIENVSATTIAKRRGPAYGCLTALLDILKATIPIGFIHKLLPRRGWIKYDYMENNAT
jgi:glycerol-3-phosphate acyltransferase PlsY